MILTKKIATLIGEMIAGATEDGICLLEFADKGRSGKVLADLSKIFGSEIRDGENIHLTELRKQLEEYFRGVRKDFELPLLLSGSDFQKKVWSELIKIPYGSTRSYIEIAAAAGNAASVRAAANANGMNRIAIIIPCHRVIGSDGGLTGYAGGLTRKKWLIDHERRFSGKEVWSEPELGLMFNE